MTSHGGESHAASPGFRGAWRVLVAHRDPAIRSAVAHALRLDGFLVREVSDGDPVRRACEDFRPDLVVLDVMLDGTAGIDIARRLQEKLPGTATIFLSGTEATTEDKVAALMVGDDYMTAPLALPELVARVRAVLRRARGDEEGILRFSDVVLNDRTHEVSRAGTSIHLTPTEFRLLRFFLLNPRRVVSRGEILADVWGKPFAEPAVVETYVGYLRRKLHRVHPPLLQTVRGVGYVLRVPRDAAV